ncbi:MAG: autotransporter domain-containing protein [Propionivibrio sp.]
MGGTGGAGGHAGGNSGTSGSGGVGIISTGNSTIHNSGTISGGVGAGGRANAIELSGGNNTLVLQVGSAITGNVLATSTDGSDLISAEASSTITGNLTSTGTVSVGTASAPNSVLTVTGNYTQGSGGIFKTTVYSDSSYGRLVVNGTANIAGSAYVNVLTANTLANGQTWSGVVSAANITNNFSSVADNSALFDFTSILNSNQIDFVVSAASTAGVSNAVSTAGISQAAGAARVLDIWVNSGTITGDTANVVTAFGQLGNLHQVSQAAAQTLPLLTAGSNSAITNLQHQVQGVFQNRLGGLRGLSSGDGQLSDGKLWAKTFGSFADQDNRKGIAGYDGNAWGLVFGGDGEYNKNTRIGAAFTYAKSDIDASTDVSGTRQNATIDSYQLSLYGSHDLATGSFIDAQFDVGQSNVDGRRDIRFGSLDRTARSDYDAWMVHIGAAFGKTLDVSAATSFTPSIRADYTWVHSDSYKETGAGALNLNVDSDTADELVLGVDGRVNHHLSENSRLTASIGVGYDVINDRSSLTSVYAGSPGLSFKTYGLEQSPWLVRGGLGVVVATRTAVLSSRLATTLKGALISSTRRPPPR